MDKMKGDCGMYEGIIFVTMDLAYNNLVNSEFLKNYNIIIMYQGISYGDDLKIRELY